MHKEKHQTLWLAFAALALIAGGLFYLFNPRTTAAQPGAAVPAATSTEVLIGQIYPGRLVILQPAEERSGGAAPTRVALLAMHGPGQAVVPVALEADGPQALGPLYPPGYGGIAAAIPAGCAKAIGTQPAASSGAAYVPNKDFEDYFAPGMPDHCEADTGLLRYEATFAVPASLPVLAVAGLPPLRADTSVAGQPRPLSTSEEAGVQTYRQGWRAEFRRAFGKDYDAEQSPTGEIPTLADAVQVAVMKEVASGRARLRVSHWGKTSVAMHLSEVFIVDQLDDEGRVLRSWHFSRPQGVLG